KPFCQLTQADIQTDRIFAQIQYSNSFELLLRDRLYTFEDMFMLCDANGFDTVFHTICQPDGTFDPPLLRSNCGVPIEPSVEEIVDSSCEHTMFLVGFWFGTTFMELYRNCYDVKTATAHFSINKVYPNYLSSDRPLTGFDRDNIISAVEADSFQKKNIYQRFKALLGPRQPYIASIQSSSFDRGHLTPVADYFFPRIMKQTNKYLNVVPQYYSTNRGNWKTVENWVRRIVKEIPDDFLNVCTGSLGVLELNNNHQQPTQIYLAPSKIRVPRWTYKIIRSGVYKKYVILTSNSGWETYRPNASSVCREVSCPLSFYPTETGYTFCCDPDDFIRRNVPRLAGVC
ncbi:hypothetical protein KR084_000943, partial [Drosophila pseudotakahashii]